MTTKGTRGKGVLTRLRDVCLFKGAKCGFEQLIGIIQLPYHKPCKGGYMRVLVISRQPA